MKKLLSLLFLVLCPVICLAQYGQAGFISSTTPITLNGYWYTAKTGGSVVASITSSNSLPVSIGDLVIVGCYAFSTQTGFTATASGGGITFTAGTLVPNTNGGGSFQSFTGFATAAATITLNCAPSASSAQQSMVGLAFSHTMTSINTSASSQNTATGASITIPQPSDSPNTMTTSQRTLLIEFGVGQNSSHIWSAGTIAGFTATMGGISAATLGSASNEAVQYYIAPSALVAFTGTIAIPSVTQYNLGSITAVNY